MDVDSLSDQESVDSSSSDEVSEGEGGNSGAVVGQGATGAPKESQAGWETTLISDDEDGDKSDGDMASAVASASKQASKFLEDSDSEEETGEESRYITQPLPSPPPFLFQSSFSSGPTCRLCLEWIARKRRYVLHLNVVVTIAVLAHIWNLFMKITFPFCWTTSLIMCSKL